MAVSRVIMPFAMKKGSLIQFTQVKMRTDVPTKISFGRRWAMRNMLTTGPAPCANVEVTPVAKPKGMPVPCEGWNSPSSAKIFSRTS